MQRLDRSQWFAIAFAVADILSLLLGILLESSVVKTACLLSALVLLPGMAVAHLACGGRSPLTLTALWGIPTGIAVATLWATLAFAIGGASWIVAAVVLLASPGAFFLRPLRGWTLPSTLGAWTKIGLTGLIGLWALIDRTLPYLSLRPLLYDLDPYRYARMAGRAAAGTPLFAADKLASAPSGTDVTPFNNAGFNALGALLENVGRSEGFQVMAWAPAVFFALACVVTVLLVQRMGGEWLSGWMAAALLIVTPSWWAYLTSVAGNPLAESLGLLLVATGALAGHRLFLEQDATAVLGLGSCIFVLPWIHPVSFFFLSLLLVAQVLASPRTLPRVVRLVWQQPSWPLAGAASWLLFGLLAAPRLRADAWSARADLLTRGDSFLVVPLTSIVGELGFLPVLGTLLGLGFAFWTQRGASRRPLIVHAIALALLFLCLLIRDLVAPGELARLPFLGGALLFTHRTIPYLGLVVAMAAGMGVVGLLKALGGSIPKVRLGVVLVGALVFVALDAALVDGDRDEHAGEIRNYRVRAFGPVMDWLENSTQPGQVVASNNADANMWARYLAQRPTLTSISYEDIVASDFPARMDLTRRIGLLAFDNETWAALDHFAVRWVLVEPLTFYVDQDGMKSSLRSVADTRASVEALDAQSQRMTIAHRDDANGIYVLGLSPP
jgi:hypothetical protein